MFAWKVNGKSDDRRRSGCGDNFCICLACSHARAGAPAAAPARGAQATQPRQQQVRTAVDEAYAKYKGGTKGKNADYIPYLAKVNPNLFGISVVTTRWSGVLRRRPQLFLLDSVHCSKSIPWHWR